MQNQFDVAQAVQQTGVDHAHDVGEIQSSILACRPTTVSAKEFSCVRVSQ
jgi:hypothetical protein